MILFSLSARELIEVMKAKESSIQIQGERPAGPPQKVAVGKSARWPSAIPNPTPGVLDARAGPPTAVPAIICFPPSISIPLPCFRCPYLPSYLPCPLSPFLLCLPGPSPYFTSICWRDIGAYFRPSTSGPHVH